MKHFGIRGRLAVVAAAAAVTLIGAPVAGATTVTPTSHNFGDVSVGASLSQTFTITNGCTSMVGNACVTPEVSRLTPSVTPVSDYSLVSSCPSELSSNGQACTVTVTFKPAAAGIRSGLLHLGPVMATLRGNGVTAQPVSRGKKCKKRKKRAAAAKKCKKRK